MISSFFLFAGVFLFATSASATEVPFERLPYGVPLHSEQPADGATPAVAPSHGSGAHDLTVQKPGAPAGEFVVLATYRTPAVRNPQPLSGVPTRSGSFGRQPFQIAGSASGLPFLRPSGSGNPSSGSGTSTPGADGNHTGVADPTDLELIPIPVPDQGEPGPRLWGDADGGDTGRQWGDVGSSSAPVPEPSAALVFGLGALIVASAIRGVARRTAVTLAAAIVVPRHR